MSSILRFPDLGEAATRRILRGWCGPLVPEPPTPAHDHRKHRLMYMDCTSPETLEGHVLTFTHSQWSGGTELVFENGTPRTEGIDVAVGRRVLSWETCWKWIKNAGLDCERPEVAMWLAGLCARALGSPASASWSIQQEIGGVFSLVGIAQRPRTSFDALIVMRWDHGRAMGYGSGGDAQHPSITTVATDGRAFLRDLVLALAPKIAALP